MASAILASSFPSKGGSPKIKGALEGPHNKEHRILGSILAPPKYGNCQTLNPKPLNEWGTLLGDAYLDTMKRAAELTAAPDSLIWGFPKIRGSMLGVPIIRTIVYWGLYWGPLVLGNYHLHQAKLSQATVKTFYSTFLGKR